MDDILYILIIIIIFVLTIFYGGHNLIKNIEYYNNYFNSNNIIIFDNKLKKFNFDENTEKIFYGKYICNYISDDHEGLDNEIKPTIINGINEYRN